MIYKLQGGGKEQWQNIYLSHRIIDIFPRILILDFYDALQYFSV